MRTQIQTEAKTQTKSGSAPVSTGLLQRKCTCGNHTMAGGECTECGKQKRFGLQTKLKVSEPGDLYEQEADRVAKQVMRMLERRTGVLIQRRIDGASIARMPALQRTEVGADKFAIESDKPKKEGSRCPGWRGDPQSISKRAGEFYARNHLTPPSQATMERIECEPPVSNGNYGCYVHFSDGLVLHVIVRETDIVVGTGPGPFTTLHPPPATPLCFYAYSCPEGDLALTVLRCQSAKPSGSSSPPAVARRAAFDAPAPIIAPPIVSDAINSPGRPLDPAVRTFFEPRFRHDFSQVRVHTDARAEESARAVNALAYTVGQDVVFGAGQYAPGTRTGQKLLAHELAHLIQQSGGGYTSRHLQRQGMNPTDVPASTVLRDAPNAKTWTGASVKCGSKFCRPLPSEGMAIDSRKSMWLLFAAGIGFAVNSRVVPLWSRWAFGGSSSIMNLTKDFGGDFNTSLTTAKTTTFLMNAIRAKLIASPPSMPPAGFVKLDIPTLIPGEVKAIDDPSSPNQMNFNAIGEIPGNIAGGIGKDQAATPIGAHPSPQNDERVAKGTVTVFSVGANMHVIPQLRYTVKDTIDLCPGDCGAKREQKATIPMSQWEATGISGDVPFMVDFMAPGLLTLPFTIPKPAASTVPASAPMP